MRVRLKYLAGFTGLLVLGLGAQPASAQDQNRVVGTLNRVFTPHDAQRLGDQARRHGRPAEARYWRDYRRGLEAQRRNRYHHRSTEDRRDHPHDQRQGYRPGYDQHRGDQGYGSSSSSARPADPGYGDRNYRHD